MRISDWSSDVCSSDLLEVHQVHVEVGGAIERPVDAVAVQGQQVPQIEPVGVVVGHAGCSTAPSSVSSRVARQPVSRRSEEHTSELQSLMRNSYAVFCLKKNMLRKIFDIHNRRDTRSILITLIR